MVTGAPEQLRDDAIGFFREERLPDSLCWVEDLPALQFRLFTVELADALKAVMLTGDYRDLVSLIEDWEATSEVAASPEIVAEIEREKDYRPLSHFTG